jgi:glyoxylase-like metal-dependent hydrolase (beta-lactamase superfamily II)
VSEAEAPTRPGRNLDYPFETRPELGETIEVAPGIHWIRMRLPMQLNHINLWLLEDGDGWTVVDTGIRDEITADAWKTLFAGAMGGKPIKRVIVTHLHPDHIGLAGWLVRRFGVELWMSRTDYLMCRNLVADTGVEAPQEGIRFYRAAGFNDEEIEAYKTRFGGFGSGHAPEHICLWSKTDNLFISGDQILPRISSNVSLFPTEPSANPLKDWLDSCAKLEALLPAETLVLPSHNEPFRGVKLRLQELIAGHETGMEKLVAICAEPKRAVECFPALFRSRITSGIHLMATGETLAHMNCLLARGGLTRSTDADGIDWYRAA